MKPYGRIVIEVNEATEKNVRKFHLQLKTGFKGVVKNK